jgi:hypothetical protein
MRRTSAILLTGFLAGCIDDPDESFVAAGLVVSPVLQLQDTFIPFAPPLFGYDLDGGTTSGRIEIDHFGATPTDVPVNLDTDHDDVPDLKMRVRITLETNVPGQNPGGDIVIHGMTYEHDHDDPTDTPFGQPQQAELHFATSQTLTTDEYFDQVTSIETDGLGVDTTMTVEWWSGHEQEVVVGATIANIADETECERDWRVYFNGQRAVPDWDPTAAQCRASLIPGAITIDGTLESSPAVRGLYLGIHEDLEARDSYHQFNEDGHTSSPSTYADWIASLSSGGSFFVSSGPLETRVRPITVELERQSDLHVVDAGRVMMTIARDPNGLRALTAMAGTTETSGAIAQLSPRGLGRLEPTHADTMPYPIVPDGTQPRLSLSAIDLDEHRSPVIRVDLKDLPDDDIDYWTVEDTTVTEQFAGYLAYEAIKGEAQFIKITLDGLLAGCNGNAACRQAFHDLYCVDDNPRPRDFRLRIDAVQSYFDPTRPDDALVIGDVNQMELTFGEERQILADFTVENIQGWLEARIDPADIVIEWDKGPLDLCTVKPADQRLSDWLVGSEDHKEWLVCHDLSFTAGSGTLGDPIPFDVETPGEKIHTPFAPGTPVVSLADVGSDLGDGICADDWLATQMTTEILAWQSAVESTIAIELVTSPGEDEALDRLLSPYELGIERINNPPPETPPYDVHPLATYELSATIEKSLADPHGYQTDPVDGLYLPYVTRSSPLADTVPFLTWFCPVGPGQSCTTTLDRHAAKLEDGLDSNGEAYDVSISYSSAHISQALWAQARRSDHLGSPNFPARLAIPDTAIVNLATALGYTDVVDALTPLGSRFGVRYHHAAAPWVLTTDSNPPHLVYVTPNIVMELVAIASDDTETVVATILVDVVDYDHQMKFTTGGVPALDASFGALALPSMTTTFVPGCHGAMNGLGCDDRLRLVLGSLWWAQVQDMFLDMVEQTPGLNRFDAGQESGKPRHLKNVRTLIENSSVVLLGDLCNPDDADCD